MYERIFTTDSLQGTTHCPIIDSKESLTCFNEVCEKLGQKKNNEIVLLDAFEAEGLLQLFAVLVKMMPSEYLLTNWNSYIMTLHAYLSHEASIVRQTTSSIYHYLVFHFLSFIHGLIVNFRYTFRS